MPEGFYGNNDSIKAMMDKYHEAQLRRLNGKDNASNAKAALEDLKKTSANITQVLEQAYKDASVANKKNIADLQRQYAEYFKGQTAILQNHFKNASITQEQYNAVSETYSKAQEQAQARINALSAAYNRERIKTLPLEERYKAISEQQRKKKEELLEIELRRKAAIEAINAENEADRQAQEAKINADAQAETDNINAQYGNQKSGILGTVSKISNLFSGGGIASSILKAVNNVSATVAKYGEKSIRETASLYSQYMGSIDARLQGSDDSFSSIAKDIKNQLTANSYVSQKEMLKRVSDLAESGIAYNIEERAYLATLTDRMVTTFDVLDASLTRLIRLQQADLTASQLGSEATLTQFLNSRFKDTSYLTDVYDSVSNAILDASSQFNIEDFTRYGYNVQKWLGSLYSTGMSSDAISMIARGIGMLTTGDVSSLNSDSSLTTLFGLAASRAGMSYSSILTQGLNAEGVNTLMKYIVELLQDISNNTSNQVTKSAWGDILNMTLADFRSTVNLSQNDINDIYNNGITYQKALDETSYQLMSVVDRTHMQTRIDNAIDNAVISWGSDLALNQDKYKNWAIGNAVADLVSSIGGGSSIIDTVANLFKGLNTLFSANTSLVNIIRDIDLTGSSGLSLFNFDWDQYTSRGSLFSAIGGYGAGSSGVTSGISYSGITSNSPEDTDLVNFEAATNSTTYNTFSPVTGSSNSVVRSASDIYAQLFDYRNTIRISVATLEDEALKKLSDAMNVEEAHKDREKIVDAVNDVGSKWSASDFQSHVDLTRSFL